MFYNYYISTIQNIEPNENKNKNCTKIYKFKINNYEQSNFNRSCR